LAPAGCSTLQIITLMPWLPFARWAAIPPAERGDDYRQLRQRLTDRLLEKVERTWPGLIGDVVVQRVATPLSNADYARAVEGGIAGPAHTVDQMGPWRFGTRTPIRGLFLAGSGVISGGVASCLSSGRAAAAMAAGRRVPTARDPAIPAAGFASAAPRS
jgi:phytoene dehydrogenase-like protein